MIIYETWICCLSSYWILYPISGTNIILIDIPPYICEPYGIGE